MLAPVGRDVDVVAEGVVEAELLAETETPVVETEVTGVEPTDAVLLTVGDVLGEFVVLLKPLTVLKGWKSSFKAVPVLGRCWHPSIKACKSSPVVISAFRGSKIVQQSRLTVDKRPYALRCGQAASTSIEFRRQDRRIRPAIIVLGGHISRVQLVLQQSLDLTARRSTGARGRCEGWA